MLELKDFEYYRGDKGLMGYMISRLITAKMLEDMDVKVSDDYIVFKQFYEDHIDTDFYIELIADFVELANIGKMTFTKFSENEMDETHCYSICFNTLASLNELKLSEKSKDLIKIFQEELESEFSSCDGDGKCEFKEGICELHFSSFMYFSFIHPICEVLKNFHESLQSILQKEMEQTK